MIDFFFNAGLASNLMFVGAAVLLGVAAWLLLTDDDARHRKHLLPGEHAR